MPDIDLTTSVHPQLAEYIQAYFRKFPALAQRANRKVMAGTYVNNSRGIEFTAFNTRKTPDYLLHIANTDVAISGSNYGFDNVTLTAGNIHQVDLIKINELADAVTDNTETLRSILSAYEQDAERWSTAIVNSTDRDSRFHTNLNEMESVPANSPTEDVAVLTGYLTRHFTYDQEGNYFAKWENPTNSEQRNFPQHTSTAYREKAVQETKLTCDQFYCYSVITRGEATAGVFNATETISQIIRVPGEEEPVVRIIYTANRRENAACSEFCFFYAAAGLNIVVPESARGSLSAEFSSLLRERNTEQVMAFATEDADWVVGGESNSKIKISAIVIPNADFSGTNQLPLGVDLISEDEPQPESSVAETEEPDEDDALADLLQENIQYFMCPPDKIIDLAANSNVIEMHRVGTAQYIVNDARGHINHAAYLTNLGVAGGAENVYVGIVDSGIDGDHPAFQGRIHKVWDQTDATDTSFPHPTGRGNDFGRVYSTRADIENHSTDENGHGTHVAGIAAGSATGTYTQTGAAANANILFVKTTMDLDHVRRGVSWIFQQAGERPCVVNLSLGYHAHGHDGVDDFALAIRRTFRRPNRSGRGYTWLPGRVVVAAAGNERDQRGHCHVDPIAASAVGTIDFTVATRLNSAGVAVTEGRITFLLFARPTPNNVRGCRLEVRVRRTGATGAGATNWQPFDPTGQTHVDTIGLNNIEITNGPSQPSSDTGLVYTRHQHVLIELRNIHGITSGNWTIDVRNVGTHPIAVNVYNTTALANGAASIFFTNATERNLIISPATAYGVIAVGATVNRASWRAQGATSDTLSQKPNFSPTTNQLTSFTPENVNDIASFSNPGPVRGTSRTIIAMAPGKGMFSARSSDGGYSANNLSRNLIDTHTIQMSGTSMASPLVAGVVGCLMENHPRITAKDVMNRLRTSVTTPAGWDTDLWGPGRLDCSQIRVR